VRGRTGIFVQIRIGSKRLPRKALLEVAGLSIARHVMRALLLVPADVRALLTDAASAKKLAPEAEAEGFAVFVGPDEDVLRRYAMAVERFPVERVVRATGDAPLVSPRLAREILVRHVELRADLSHFVRCPLGTGVEVIETAALARADREAVDAYEREHITTYLYRHRSRPFRVSSARRFRVLEAACPRGCRWKGRRHVTVDTLEDYKHVCRIFAALYDGRPIEADRIVRWLKGSAA